MRERRKGALFQLEGLLPMFLKGGSPPLLMRTAPEGRGEGRGRGRGRRSELEEVRKNESKLCAVSWVDSFKLLQVSTLPIFCISAAFCISAPRA